MELPVAKKTNNGYLIKYEGIEYNIRKMGNKWELNGKLLESLKEAKKYIVDNSGEDTEIPEVVEKAGLWDCMRPIAIVVLLLEELGREPTEIEKIALNSLGMYENGQMDVEGAKRELARVRNILKVS